MIFGVLADILITRGCLTKRALRWLFHDIGFGIPAISACLLGYTTDNWILCMAIMSLGMGFRAAQYSGHYQVCYDIAPKYSGTVYGMVNMIGNSAGFITPLLTSALTAHDPKDITGWRQLFWIAGSLYGSCVILFMLFAKFEPASFEYDDLSKPLHENDILSPVQSPMREQKRELMKA